MIELVTVRKLPKVEYSEYLTLILDFFSIKEWNVCQKQLSVQRRGGVCLCLRGEVNFTGFRVAGDRHQEVGSQCEGTVQ